MLRSFSATAIPAAPLISIPLTFRKSFYRSEWEARIKGPHPDLSATQDSPLKRVLKKSTGPLKPLFETRVYRTVRWFKNAETNIQSHLIEVKSVQARVPNPYVSLSLS